MDFTVTSSKSILFYVPTDLPGLIFLVWTVLYVNLLQIELSEQLIAPVFA